MPKKKKMFYGQKHQQMAGGETQRLLTGSFWKVSKQTVCVRACLCSTINRITRQCITQKLKLNRPQLAWQWCRSLCDWPSREWPIGRGSRTDGGKRPVLTPEVNMNHWPHYHNKEPVLLSALAEPANHNLSYLFRPITTRQRFTGRLSWGRGWWCHIIITLIALSHDYP